MSDVSILVFEIPLSSSNLWSPFAEFFSSSRQPVPMATRTANIESEST